MAMHLLVKIARLSIENIWKAKTVLLIQNLLTFQTIIGHKKSPLTKIKILVLSKFL